jgi:hypothetical protein
MESASIRKEKARPWVVNGVPIILYQHKDRNGLEEAPDPTLLATLRKI